MSEAPVPPKPLNPADFGLTQEFLDTLKAAPIGSRVGNEKFKILYALFVEAPAILAMVFLTILACRHLGIQNEKIAYWLVLIAAILFLESMPEVLKRREEARLCCRFGVGTMQLVAFRNAEAEHQKRVAEYTQRKSEHEDFLSRSQRAFWLSLSPNQFEHEVGRLYRRLGYSAVVTKQSRDGGADVILRAEHGTTIVQCKAHQRKIGVKSFRELYGVLGEFGAESAILVCLHGATDDARRFSQGKPIRVVMLNDLVQMSRELADDIGDAGNT